MTPASQGGGDAEEVRQLLEMLETSDGQRLASLSPEEARRRQAAIASQATGGPQVDRVEDLEVAGDGRVIDARAYAASPGTSLPVLLYLHGGGFVTGDLDIHDFRCRSLARAANCLLVSLDYRLAPEQPFPAAADDAYAALEWLSAKAADLGGDPSRLAVAGDSSGGNIAAAAALMARDRGRPRLALQVLTCPMLDRGLDTPSMREFADGYVLGRADADWCWSHYLSADDDAADPYACPAHAPDLAGVAPALVVTAELDPLRDEGEEYARRLVEAGVPVRVHRYPGMIHSFVDFEQSLSAARAAVEEAASALREAWSRSS